MLSSESDREKEDETAAILSKKWEMVIRRLRDRFHPVDFYAYRVPEKKTVGELGPMVAVMELKTRDNSITRYPTVIFAYRKWFALESYRQHGVRSLFVVRFTDGIYCVRTPDAVKGLKVMVSGRDDRGLQNDIEPAFMVPVGRLKLVE